MYKQKREFKMYDLIHPEKSICIIIEEEEKICSAQAGINDVHNFIEKAYQQDSFSHRLIAYMNDKNISSKDIYNRSYIDRKLLHKIIANESYHPSKKTAFGLCVALQLDYQQSVDFLELANYSFAQNNRYDLIFQFILEERIYNLDTINEFLEYYHFPCLGE